MDPIYRVIFSRRRHEISMNNFYIYGHYTADTNELFYIGKGSGRRAWATSGRNPYWTRKANKHGFVVKLLQENLNEETAFTREKELIAEVGLEKLTNIIEGGDGPTSADMKRLWSNPEMRKKAKLAGQRRSQNPVWKARHDAAMRENAKKPEILAKLRQLALRKSQDERFKKQQREILIGLTKTPQWKAAHQRAMERRLAKTYEGFIAPDGTVYANVYNLKKFCETHGLDEDVMRLVANGRQRTHRGWRKIGTPEVRPHTNPNNTHVYPQFVSPTGDIYTNITDLHQFCTTHGLDVYAMHRVYLGKSQHHKGWRTTTTPIQYHGMKTYTGFVSPSGVTYTNIPRLSEFCRTHGLDGSNMRKLDRGEAKSYKGWTRYYSPEEIETGKGPVDRSAEYSANRKAAAKKRAQDPQWRQRMSDQTKRMWADPTYRTRMVHKQRERFNTQDARDKSAKCHAGLIAPDGTVYTDIFNLKAFAQTHQLSYKALLQLKNGKLKRHKGWTYINPPADTKRYAFVDPNGTIYPHITNLSQFAKTHQVSLKEMYKLHHGTYQQYQGWTKYISKNTL